MFEISDRSSNSIVDFIIRFIIELTENLRKLDPQDPIKYDFAMFGYGVNNK